MCAEQTWPQIRNQLWPIQLGNFTSTDGSFQQRSELTSDQQQLLATLQVPEPPRLGLIRPGTQATLV